MRSGAARHYRAVAHPGSLCDHLGLVPADGSGAPPSAPGPGLAGAATALGAVSRRVPHRLRLVAVGVLHQPAGGVRSRSFHRDLARARDADETANRRRAGRSCSRRGLPGLSYVDRWSWGTAGLVSRSPWCGWIAALIVSFLVVEARSSHPMVPLNIFRSRQFSRRQSRDLRRVRGAGFRHLPPRCAPPDRFGYSAPRGWRCAHPDHRAYAHVRPGWGFLAQRIGPRLPMTVGPIIVGGRQCFAACLGSRLARPTDEGAPAVLVLGAGSWSLSLR